MDKPIQINIEEAKQEIVNSINEIVSERGLDYYFLHLIMKDIFNEISANKDLEISQMLEEQKNNKEKKEIKKEGN